MPTIDGLFACGYDVIVFVDESDAGPAQDDGSRFVLGRAIARTDRRAIREVSRLLGEECAERWHASQRGRTSLLTSARCDEILGALAALGSSWQFDLRSTPSELLRLGDQYRELLESDPQLAEDWPQGNRTGHW